MALLVPGLARDDLHVKRQRARKQPQTQAQVRQLALLWSFAVTALLHSGLHDIVSYRTHNRNIKRLTSPLIIPRQSSEPHTSPLHYRTRIALRHIAGVRRLLHGRVYTRGVKRLSTYATTPRTHRGTPCARPCPR